MMLMQKERNSRYQQQTRGMTDILWYISSINQYTMVYINNIQLLWYIMVYIINVIYIQLLYPLVMTYIAMEAMVHRNRWFSY